MSRALFPLVLSMLFVSAAPAQGAEPAPEPADPALEAALTAQYGAGFLPALRELGITPKDYAYAARLTSAGIQKLKESDFQDARYLLEKAYSIVPSPNVLHWIGLTYLGLDDAVRARAFFLRFLAEAGTWTLTPIKEDLLSDTRAQIARLERALVRLLVTVSQPGAKIYLDGEFVGASPLPGPLHLAPGPHQLIVIKAGFARQAARLTLDAPGRIVEEKITLLTEAEHIRRTSLFRETEARRLATERRLAQTRLRVRLEAERRRAAYARYGRAALIAGATLAAVTITTGLLTLHYEDRVENAHVDTPWKQVAADQDKADFFRTTTLAALGMTILSLGASTWLTQLSIPPTGERPQARRGPTVTPLVSDTALGLTFGWVF